MRYIQQSGSNMRFLTIILVLVFASNVWAEKKERKNKNGQVIERYEIDSGGRVVGKRETFFDNGKPHIVGEWDGRPNSETEYFEDGKIARKSEYKKTGTHPEIERTEYYQNGKMKLHVRREYGKWPVDTQENIELYYDNGNLQESTQEKGGRKTGTQKFFDKDGRPTAVQIYSDESEPTGTWSFTAYEGDVRLTEETYDKGKLAKRTTFGEAKKKMSETTFYPDGSTKDEKKF